jgi:hypothetical protein
VRVLTEDKGREFWSLNILVMEQICRVSAFGLGTSGCGEEDIENQTNQPKGKKEQGRFK